MRRLLPACLVALALAVSVAPVHAQSTILDRKPMDVGADQVGALRQVSQDMLYPYRYPKLWFDAGIAYPVGNLQDRNIDPGLMLRFNQTFWHSGTLSAYGSVGAMFGNDSYFNDAQNAIAAAAPISTDSSNTYSGVDIQSRYFWMVPATVNGQFALKLNDGIDLSIAAGPGVVWTHESYITSAVNNGVGTQTVGTGGEIDPLVTGPGGEQEISPYAIRSSSKFNLGWDARAGVGFRVGKGDRPMWMRLMVGGTTYYTHTAPSTNMAFALSFGR
jgi:hypothetical protein